MKEEKKKEEGNKSDTGVKKICERIARQDLGDKVAVCTFSGMQEVGGGEKRLIFLHSHHFDAVNKPYSICTLKHPDSPGRTQRPVLLSPRIFSTALKDRGVELTTHFHPVPRLTIITAFHMPSSPA
jgi:hypothetical protein